MGSCEKIDHCEEEGRSDEGSPECEHLGLKEDDNASSEGSSSRERKKKVKSRKERMCEDCGRV